MDCIQAQTVISEALDRSPVDADVFDAAKTHCRECPQCGHFVRSLNAVRRAAPPQPPADLADRIMDAIRTEAAAAEQLPANLDSEAANSAASDSETDLATSLGDATAEGDVARDVETLPNRVPAAVQPDVADATPRPATGPRISVGRGRMDRRQLVAWGSAAAVLLVVVGVSAALALMRLTSGEPTRSASTDVVQLAAPEAAAPTRAAEGPTHGVSADMTRLGAGYDKSASARAYVVFGGNTYSFQDVSPQPKNELRASGEVRMAFDATTPPGPLTVYTGEAPEAIYIENGAAELQRFVLVKRMYKDAEYRLRSADIPVYGSWPTIPTGTQGSSPFTAPVPEISADGSPLFVLDGNDSAGTPVYRRVGGESRAGIAIAPGTPANDPAGGNPNWTWWTP